MLKHTLRFLAIAAAALSLSACGVFDLAKAFGSASTTTVDTKTLKQVAFTIYGTYTVVREAAAGYASLPRCTATVTSGCSQQAVVNELRRLDNIAAPKVQAMATYARQSAPAVSVLQGAIDLAKLTVGEFSNYAFSKGVN